MGSKMPQPLPNAQKGYNGPPRAPQTGGQATPGQPQARPKIQVSPPPPPKR